MPVIGLPRHPGSCFYCGQPIPLAKHNQEFCSSIHRSKWHILVRRAIRKANLHCPPAAEIARERVNESLERTDRTWMTLTRGIEVETP